MEQLLLEYGPLGIMVLGLASISLVLWRENQSLRNKYITLLELVLEQQKDFDRTLNKLSDGMAAQELIRQYIEERRRHGKEDT